METSVEEAGLGTREALRKLHFEIEAVLQQLRIAQKARWVRSVVGCLDSDLSLQEDEVVDPGHVSPREPAQHHQLGVGGVSGVGGGRTVRCKFDR